MMECRPILFDRLTRTRWHAARHRRRGALDRLLQDRAITIVTFASDEALAAHHDLRLVLEAGGMWSTQPIHIERPVT